MIELTPRTIRNAVIVGFVFGLAVTISNAVITEIRYGIFPPSWAKPLQCPELNQ